MSSMTELFGEPIHTYTRADALADGTLIDVSETAREAGFRIPVVLTRAVYEDCVRWTDADNNRKGTLQDEAGRLWDVLMMAWFAAARTRGAGRATVKLRRVPRAGRGQMPRLVAVEAVISGDMDGTVACVIQQFGED